MGDGPSYDYAYERARQHAARKKDTQQKRTEQLLGIMRSVGFGDSDGELSELEKEAARHLRLAYDLFSMLSQ